jgi:hypothetical protein
MWTWIWLLLLPIIVLLLIEELSQLVWRSYLKNPQEEKDNILVRTIKGFRKIRHRFRKDPSH